MARYSGQRTTRSTSGSSTPTRMGRLGWVTGEAYRARRTPALRRSARPTCRSRGPPAGSAFAARRGGRDAAVLLAQALDCRPGITLVIGVGGCGGQLPFGGTPLGQDRHGVAARWRIADRLVDDRFAVLDVGVDLLGELDLLTAREEESA